MAQAKAAKSYEVTGRQAVLGRAQGERLTSNDFTDPNQEARLVESGAITPVTPAPASGDKKDKESQ